MISDLGAERVSKFLGFLQTERKTGIATRNARLGAIHVFARFLASHHPEQLGFLQRVIGLPFKHGAREATIEYLERTEMEALLKSIDRKQPLGRRDYAPQLPLPQPRPLHCSLAARRSAATKPGCHAL